MQVEAEADSLAAKLKVDFGRAGEEALPSEESLVGQSADDHVYKVCVRGGGARWGLWYPRRSFSR